jgi:hypothetical protein
MFIPQSQKIFMRGGLPLLALLLVSALVAAFTVAPRSAQAQAAPGEPFIIGYSVEGQPIEGFRMGHGPRSLVLVGAIHGSEGNSAALVRDMHDLFAHNRHLLAPEFSLYIVPALNPDGLQDNVRYNANGVDLNRNWPSDNWQTDTYDASGLVPGGGGPYPLSEPETAAMAGWLLYLRDTSTSLDVIFYHSAYPPSGLVLGGSVGAPFTPAYADVVGYGKPAPSRPGWSAYPVTGVAPWWCGDNSIGCFEIELPSRANLVPTQVVQHATAVISVMTRQQVAPGQRCFWETGWCVSGRIREFWERQGGVGVFGMPIGPEQQLVVDGVPRQVQWFERTRLEIHPERARPADVQVGRIGPERLEQQGRSWFTFPRSAAQEGCRYFPETGQNLCGDMLNVWQASGLELDGRPGFSEDESLALLGMPISPPQTETLDDGQTRTVQWFERARFEVHAPGDVRRSLLGTEIQRAVSQ